MHDARVDVRGNLWGSVPPFGSHGPNSDCQAGQQAPLPSEPTADMETKTTNKKHEQNPRAPLATQAGLELT